MTMPSIASIEPIVGGRVIACHGPTLEVAGLALPIGQLARAGRDGVLTDTIAFSPSASIVAPLSRAGGLGPGDRVWPVGIAPIAAPFGRVVDALGRAIDGRGPLVAAPLAVASSLAPATRGPVIAPFPTGVRALDALLTLGIGQRIAVVAPAGVGKTTLLQSILNGSDADAVVVALIGERGREISDFARQAVSDRTIIVAATSDEAPALRLCAADRAHAIAEGLRGEGRSVLLLFDSMTRVAQAQRELGLALGEPAALGAYPPSAFALIPRLVERAGNDVRSGGSITAIYTALSEAGDDDDPVVDALRAATDGHITLSRTLAERGIYPAIDLPKSLSRTMSGVVTPDHLADAMRARRLAALGEEARELQLIGAYAPGVDPEADEAITKRAAIGQLIEQGEAPVTFANARAELAELVAL